MSIQKRTVYFDNTGGFTRFWDWATVTTTLGTMFEPFVVNNRVGNNGDIQFDPEDEINRIDDIRNVSVDKEQLILGENHVNGGVLLSRLNNAR